MFKVVEMLITLNSHTHKEGNKILKIFLVAKFSKLNKKVRCLSLPKQVHLEEQVVNS